MRRPIKYHTRFRSISKQEDIDMDHGFKQRLAFGPLTPLSDPSLPQASLKTSTNFRLDSK